MKILILGGTGQVGWELQRALSPLGELVVPARGDADLSEPDCLRQLVRRVQAPVIVNAAAYTRVDDAESDPELAWRVNAQAVHLLAREAADSGACVVHYSTDYVFDGTKSEPYTEDDSMRPVNVYGATKEGGERALRQVLDRHLILRTSWVYASRGRNFPTTIANLARERTSLSVVDDQVGAPTSAELIADVTAHALHRVMKAESTADWGTYNLVARGETSWHGFARFILACLSGRGVALRCAEADIRPITSGERPTAARRPANSRLNVDRLERRFDLCLPHWEWHARRWCEAITWPVPDDARK